MANPRPDDKKHSRYNKWYREGRKKDMVIKTVDLDNEQIDLIVKVLKEKRDDLDVLLKNPDGLDVETVRELQLEHRDIGNVLRELQFYMIMK